MHILFKVDYALFLDLLYEACSEIIKTLAFYPEHIDIGKQNSAWITIDLL